MRVSHSLKLLDEQLLLVEILESLLLYQEALPLERVLLRAHGIQHHEAELRLGLPQQRQDGVLVLQLRDTESRVTFQVSQLCHVWCPRRGKEKMNTHSSPLVAARPPACCAAETAACARRWCSAAAPVGGAASADGTPTRAGWPPRVAAASGPEGRTESELQDTEQEVNLAAAAAAEVC